MIISSGVNTPNSNKKLIKYVDVLGRETKETIKAVYYSISMMMEQWRRQ